MTSAQQLAYDEFVHNIFVTALEGGIDYWFVSKTYQWELGVGGGCDLENFRATGYCNDDEDPELLTIDKDVIVWGLLRIIGGDATFGGKPLTEDDHLFKTVQAACEYDPEYGYDVNTVVDADIADCIVQVGLFGDVRYG